MKKYHKEIVDRKKVRLIDFLTFLLGFAQAVLIYVMSTYFYRAFETDNVGVFYFISYSSVLFLLLNLHKLIKKYGGIFLFQVTFVFKILAISMLIFLPPSAWGVLFLMIYIVTGVLAWALLDVILESFSEDKSSGRIRGTHLVTLNSGLIMGPLLSSRLLESYDFAGIFFVSLLIHSVVFIIALIWLRYTNHSFKRNISLKKLFKKVVKRRNIRRIYYISFALDFFYALMLIYVPLYLLQLGFNWQQLGVAFTIMLIPFLIIQYPAGLMADKKIGEKELIILALLIMGISTLFFFFSNSTDVMTWTFILLGTRVGVAMIEVLRDSYFYKRVDGNDVEVIEFYKTSKPVAFIVASIFSSFILLFAPLKFVFLAVALVSFVALVPAFHLKDNKSESEMKLKGSTASN